MAIVELDLHGVRHSEVKAMLSNEFFWKNLKEVEVITGNSVKLKNIVRDWFHENHIEYIEYIHKASFIGYQ